MNFDHKHDSSTPYYDIIDTYVFVKLRKLFKLAISYQLTSSNMAPVVPKWAEFGQNQKYIIIRKTKLGNVTKFQKATPNGLGVIKK